MKPRNLDPDYVKNLEILDSSEAAAYLRTSTSTLAKLRCYSDDGPRFIRQSARKVLYRRADLDAWLNRKLARTGAHGEAVA
ncbi:helix-turn-helix domain-containing protein [Roseinatronobacter alkalisoli]|uniref:Helix-turn-helix domain-containing protein n=1 Tax=Roseinatronobacter alkalisoli TaxID=3028235 RepID=A0ABT5TGA4_9RHOB|nr:helix-turn-helix domain-containing protein [Roseinatronobacter sp. HJB301]MDD7973202.1 helix-turn-helix domain-containing protein [Roseinatronobacter sp. HJB301]